MIIEPASIKQKFGGREPSSDMNRNKSTFHSKWLLIKENKEYQKDEFLFEQLEKSKKSKTPTMGEKVTSANIKEWKEQRWLPCAFFQNFQKLFCDTSQLGETYENLEKVPISLPNNTNIFEEGDLEYLHLDPSVKKTVDDYSREIQSVYLKNGLTEQEVQLRLNINGPNKLPERKKTPEIVKYLREITNLFSIVLWMASALSFIGYGLAPNEQSNLWLAIVIICIILITGTFSWYQSRKSDSIIDSFKSFGTSQVTVIRNGKMTQIPAVNLVRGDVVLVRMGDKIPADIRIFDSNDLQVDNSSLTGESLPIKITTSCGDKGLDNPLEATNLVFFSTLCKNGSGVGVVIQTGPNTFMGKIADLAYSAGPALTTLQKEINDFTKLIARSAVSFGLIFFILGFIIKYPVITNFIFAIGIVVANVPEGLLIVVTITLAITARKMLKKNVMVKNLQSVETLGSITVICSDKTGTLTQNKMTVVHLWYDKEIKKIKDDQQDIYIDNKLINMKTFKVHDESFSLLQFVGVCGSKGKFIEVTPDDYIPVVQGRNKFTEQHPKATYEEILSEIARLKILYQKEYKKEYDTNIDERITDTDASETGILKFFENIEDIEKVRKKFPLHVEPHQNKSVIIPFNSTLKFTSFLRRVNNQVDPLKYTFMLALKGAPEKVIERCNSYLLYGKELPIDDNFINEYQLANKCFALKGERVIGLAYTKLDPTIFKEEFKFLNHPQEEHDPEFKYEVPKAKLIQ